MTIKASDHCAEQFSHSAPGLISGHTFGPPPTFGAWHRKENVFYIDASVIVLPDTRIASGENIIIAEFEDHRGGLVDPQDGTSKRVLHVVVIPESLAPGDYVHLSIGGQALGVDVPATLMQNVVIPGVGIKQTPVQIVQAKAPPVPAPAPVVITPTKPITGRTNGNGNSHTTIPATIITPSTPRQIVVPLEPTDRQLVVYESNTANSDYGRLFGIPPGDARGIGLPAYKIVTSLPSIGGVAGEAVFDSSTKAAYVWDGNIWQRMPPRAEIPEWNNTQAYGDREVVEWQDALWVSTQVTAVNTPPDGIVANWRRITSTTVPPIFGAFDLTTNYKVGDHVYFQTSVYKALTNSLGAWPSWSKTTTEWECVGNLLNYNPDPAANDMTDGSVLTYIGARYVLRKPTEGVQRLSGVDKATYQCGVIKSTPVMQTPPTKHVKFTASARMNGSAACYIPTIIVNSSGWADLGAANYAPEDQTYSAFNQEAGISSVGFLDNAGLQQFVVKDFTDADWGNDGDGFRTVPGSMFNLMAAGTIIDGRRGSGKLIFEAHVNEGDGRWDCHYTYVGSMGNHKANYGRIEMGWSWPKELFDNMTGIGYKMLQRPGKTHTTEIDFRWQCEWH